MDEHLLWWWWEIASCGFISCLNDLECISHISLILYIKDLVSPCSDLYPRFGVVQGLLGNLTYKAGSNWWPLSSGLGTRWLPFQIHQYQAFSKHLKYKAPNYWPSFFGKYQTRPATCGSVGTNPLMVTSPFSASFQRQVRVRGVTSSGARNAAIVLLAFNLSCCAMGHPQW
jgi:hypothetical protein